MGVGEDVLEPVRRPPEPGHAVHGVADDRVAQRRVAHLAALAAPGSQDHQVSGQRIGHVSPEPHLEGGHADVLVHGRETVVDGRKVLADPFRICKILAPGADRGTRCGRAGARIRDSSRLGHFSHPRLTCFSAACPLRAPTQVMPPRARG